MPSNAERSEGELLVLEDNKTGTHKTQDTEGSVSEDTQLLSHSSIQCWHCAPLALSALLSAALVQPASGGSFEAAHRLPFSPSEH